MKRNATLMTRGNFFADEGLEYDVDVIRRKESEYFNEHTKNGTGALWIPKELDARGIERRHEEIDMLTGTNKEQRSPSDTVLVKILDFLIEKIKLTSENIKLRVDQNVAHAASPESRQDAKSEETSVTLGYLWDSHKTICQVGNFIDVYLLSRANHTFMPTPQYDHLEFIDKPLVLTENIELISDAWHEFHRETDSWGDWGPGNLKEEMDSVLQL